MPRRGTTPPTADPACTLLTVEQAARRLGVGRSTMYALLSRGEIESIQIGHLRRIPVDAIGIFIDERRAAAAMAYGV
ncbi:MAG: helix-turn-helix domain-containing protein [Frankiales bacterium]|jgi:excisionase family DNA binding protein|nr:helix-turn-helix domain-containing protein [Frankiales bacterium]